MPDQSTATFSGQNILGPNPPTWYCIFLHATGAPVALWNEEQEYWVTFEEQEHIPALDHLDPRKIEKGEQKVVLFPEDVTLEQDYEKMTTSYLRWLVEEAEDDEVREAAEEELSRRKDHYEITGSEVSR